MRSISKSVLALALLSLPAALAALVKAKIEGKELPKRPARKAENVVDLMEALRQSAGVKEKAAAAKKKVAAKKKAGESAKNEPDVQSAE